MDGAAAADAHGGFLTRGHDSAVRLLARAVAAEHPPHALLLVGPRGVGKTTLALDLAAGLLCLDADPSRRPCRSCAACRKVENDNHADLHVVAPEGAGEQIRLGQVQRLASELALTPMEGRFRVAVISAAQRLNPDAQNALLKTLEEPGPQTCLVLCADDQAPLLPTVVSRAARLRLAALPTERLADALVADGAADPPTARALAIASAGRPGLALALVAQPDAVLARARIGRGLLDLVDADRRDRLGAAADLIVDGAALDAAVRGEVPPTSRLQPVERRRAVIAVLEVWREVGRDLAIATYGGPDRIRDLDLLEELVSVSGRIDTAALLRFMDRLDRLVLAIEGYASPELALDTLLLTWPRAASDRARDVA